MSTKDRAYILAFLEARLTEKRLKHSLGVERSAEHLAIRYGADAKRAALAGLVHDAAKNMSDEELCENAKSLPENLSEYAEKNPALLHGPVGAYIVKTELGITDTEVLNAIKYHTTGRAGMSKLEKIIYLADMIEENRTFPGVEELRELAEKDLDAAVMAAIRFVMEFVKRRGLYAAKESQQAYESLKGGAQ